MNKKILKSYLVPGITALACVIIPAVLIKFNFLSADVLLLEYFFFANIN